MKEIEKELHNYYSENLNSFGVSAKGVGWKNENAQQVRFEQLLKIVQPLQPFTLNDVGCGIGDLFFYLKNRSLPVTIYNGYDALEDMVTTTTARLARQPDVRINQIATVADISTADYSVASGIFSLKYNLPDFKWSAYILETLDQINQHSTKGFAFNMLTKYSDKELMLPHLYYGDPSYFFDHCKKHFSKNVALLHDYNEYDFTILVRK